MTSLHRWSSGATAALLGCACITSAAMGQGRRAGVLIQSGRTDVVISTPAQRDAAGETARLSALVQGCRRRIGIAPEDSATFVNAALPGVPSANGSDLLVLSVLPHQASAVDCEDEQAQLTVAAMRGLRVTTDTTYVPDRDLQQVILRRGGTVIDVLAGRRESLHRVVPGGIREPKMGWIVLAVDATQFAPRPDGAAERITIEVRTAAGGIPEVFELPWSALREAWERAIAARMAPALDPLLSAPANARAGVEARARTGVALVARGDSAAARVVFGALLSTEPCFTFAPDVDPRAREILGAMRRPAARCTAQRPVVTFTRAALVPGFGRRATDDGWVRRAAVVAAVATGTAFAVQRSHTANERYRVYLAMQYANPLLAYEIAHGRAEDARLNANRIGAATFALWGAQIVHAMWLERQYAARLESVRGFDTTRDARAIGLAPFVDASRVGFIGRIGW